MNNTRESLSLDGEWKFVLDPTDEIEVEGHRFEDSLDVINVPGSWEEQGFGKTNGDHFPLGTWKKEREYIGKAWYSIELDTSSLPENQHHRLVMSGVHWFTSVWIDGDFVGNGEGLVTDHQFDITPFLEHGKTQKLVISVDNRLHIPLMESHIHSYHTATNWGGITGGVKIESFPSSHFSKVMFLQEESPKQFNIRAEVDLGEGRSSNKTYSVNVVINKGAMKPVTVSHQLNGNQQLESVDLHIDMGENAEVWSDKTPSLYDVSIKLMENNETIDCKNHRIGLRDFKAVGKQFLLNEQPVFLSGYVDCCVFPMTGYPSWDKEHYKKQFKIVKEHGYNHVRLHGWSAPKPFWEAADEEGMLVQTELPHWSFHYLERETAPPVEVHEFLTRELVRIIEHLNEHPSFVMMALGNELISASGHPLLNELVELARKKDPTRLFTDNTGFGQLPVHDREGDFFIQSLNWHPPYALPYAGSPDTTEDYRELPKLVDKPVIGHEHGQFTMYVDPNLSDKFTGHLQPSWLETFNESLEGKGWNDRVEEFKKVTGSHMVRSYKEIMERARRTKDLSGIQLLDIRDFPGQGHATTGILDVFWDSKNVIEPKDFKQFNNDRVMLMRSDRRTFYGGETAEVDIELSNYGANVQQGRLTWEVRVDEQTLDQGEWDLNNLKAGENCRLGTINFETSTKGSSQYRLHVELKINDEHETIENSWDFWSFGRTDLPKGVKDIWTDMNSLQSYLYGARFEELIGIEERSYKKEDAKLAITDQMSRDVVQYLLDGGNVWLMAKGGNQYDEVTTKYLPIFWNFLWFPTQESTTMGMIINKHPLFNQFPHDGLSNWQWYHLVDGAPSISLDSYPQIKPIVEVVDNFHRMKRLTYAFEAKVGRGKLFVSCFRTYDAKDLKRPETSKLFQETLDYIGSDKFQPKAKMTITDIVGMFKLKA
ncbi:glycoside hydrolase family 2 protein [Salipaludibacillus sp. HK11]|uniref:glycoside hydrolase family 2 protein n=1 Tax=Salipaludibacillus sp. HK11 TaxID=3394320 RepID=UPI0039FD7F8F